MLQRFWTSKFAAACVALWLLAGCAGIPGGAPALRHAEVNGAQLAYVEEGRGAPVVFVHGSMSDHRTWDRQRSTVAAEGWRAIAYSQRYFGTEKWNDSWPKFGVPTHSADLAAFIRALGAGPVHLVAWSYSGHVVLDVALKNAELVRSAFIYEPAVPSYVSDAADLKALTEDRALLAGPAVAAFKSGDLAASARLFHDGVENRAGVLEGMSAYAQAIVRDNTRTLPLLLASQPPPAIGCAQLGEVKPPVAIVRGELTRPFYRIIADAAAKCMPHARRIVAPGARHMWPGDEPQAFSAELAGFLRQQR